MNAMTLPTASTRFLFVLLCSLTTGAVANDDLKAFPSAQAGMQRYVIRVPAVAAPEERKLEVMIGKQVLVDCNRQRFSAHVEEKVAQGWGYTYYEVGRLSGPASTLMACPPGESKTETFVQVATAELASLRYNPQLPVVIYVPDGVEVRYRVWSAGPVQQQEPVE